MGRVSRLAVVLFGSGALTGLAAQAPIRLTNRIDSPVTFSRIAAVVPLADGRLVVSDPVEGSVHLLDAALRRVTGVGRVGEGPGEFQHPAGLYRLRGDTVLLHDDIGHRFVKISPTGAAGEVVPIRLRDRLSAFERTLRSDPELLRIGADGRACARIALSRSVTADSSDVLCGRYDGTTVTPATTVRVPARAPLEYTDGRGPGILVNVRFAIADGWAVAEDGALAVARSAPYRIEWHEPDGTVARGPVIPYAPIPVSRQERASVVAEVAERNATPAPASGARVVTPNGARIDPNAVLQGAKPPIADTKGPFDPTQILAGPGRELWVLRSGAAGATPRYDVFGADGRRVSVVDLPLGHRVVAATSNAIYTAHEDGDGLWMLSRWGRP